MNQLDQLEALKKNIDLVKSLQNDMGSKFFDYLTYDIKDALTSILAICDMEEMRQIEQVKIHIKQVNCLLDDIKLYGNNSIFNIKQVIVNIINILKNQYKTKAQIKYKITSIGGFVKGDKIYLENILLYILVESLEKGEKNLNLELYQKEHKAIIKISLNDNLLSDLVMKEIKTFSEEISLKFFIDPKKQKTEIFFYIPLSFDNNSQFLSKEKTTKIKLKNITRKKVSLSSKNGAQERT